MSDIVETTKQVVDGQELAVVEQAGGGLPRVAVYGSLREGLHNHSCLSAYGATKLGDLTLPSSMGFRMVSLGGFPAVLEATDDIATDLKVEVYEVSEQCLELLDSLEGHPDWYKRQKITTPWKRAWMYVMPEEDYEDHIPVDNGDWLEFYNNKRTA